MIKVSVLGINYTIKKLSPKDDKRLELCDGFCDYTTKEIIISDLGEQELSVKDLSKHYEHVLKHELVHAFLNESGLMSSSQDSWAVNEEVVDWIALQLEKINNAFKEVKEQINEKK